MIEASVVRRYAELADSGFDTLDTEDAIAVARCSLRDLLRYLERADDPHSVSFIGMIDSGRLVASVS